MNISANDDLNSLLIAMRQAPAGHEALEAGLKLMEFLNNYVEAAIAQALAPQLFPAVVKESLIPEPTVRHEQSSEDAPRQCWSADEEDYNSNTLAELLDSHPHLTVGSVVWRGEPCRPGASELFDADDAMEMMRDRACDIAGEYADDYPNVSTEDVAELNSLIVGWIDSKAAPTFYTVKNVQPYTLTAIDVGQQAEA